VQKDTKYKAFFHNKHYTELEAIRSLSTKIFNKGITGGVCVVSNLYMQAQTYFASNHIYLHLCQAPVGRTCGEEYAFVTVSVKQCDGVNDPLQN